ncbi:MAG: gliding motility protein RemB [Sphingobacteriales bacterium]|nr:MAG: gliding motility protein RemB [Sphingobacteriales bacterium]
MIKKYFLFIFIIASLSASAQTPNVYQPYSFQFYQKFDKYVYNPNTRFHTSLKPYFADDSLLKAPLDSFYNIGAETRKRSWIRRVVRTQHLIQVTNKDFTFYGDYLPDYSIGRELVQNKTTWLDSKGFQFGGTIGKKFSFYTSAFENQAAVPKYLEQYIAATRVIPGQSAYNSYATKTNNNPDYSYVTALASYTPNKYVNFTLGQDKIFIGDGYRSMILSDFASTYPLFKVTANIGNVQYSAIWASMQDIRAKPLSYDTGYRKKGGVFHYLDWNVNNRLSLGFFDAIIWADKDDLGNPRGFDPTYINPFIFLRIVERNNGSPDNALVGFTSKYKLSKGATIYGQFVLDELEGKNFFSNTGSARNKWGAQLGIRGANLFNIERFNYLTEYNVARPYTYTSRPYGESKTTSIGNYAHFSEPLAHPFGANFREFVTILSYSIDKIDFFGKVNYGIYGLNFNSDNYGKDIFLPYNTVVEHPGKTNGAGQRIAQGLKTDLLYLDGRVSYLLNPKYNLRIELGAVLRSETNNLANNQTKWLTLGVRSSFRNLYYDF